jgi:hypothetical protein
MGDEYMDTQDSLLSEMQKMVAKEIVDSANELPKDYNDMMGYDDGSYEDEDGSFRGGRGRGNFRLESCTTCSVALRYSPYFEFLRAIPASACVNIYADLMNLYTYSK